MDANTETSVFIIEEEKSPPKLFDESTRAFDLISQGEEAKAKHDFPLEYFFIRKYVSSGLSELKELLRLKLELH